MTAEHFSEPQASISQLHFDYIRAMVREESSIVLDDGKMYLVISRLSPLAREHGFASVGAFISHLQCTCVFANYQTIYPYLRRLIIQSGFPAMILEPPTP